MESLTKPWRLVWIFSTVFWSYAEAVETSVSSELKLFKDASFPVLSKVMGRNVTCGAHIPAEFPGPTWTCADLKVNGLRMAYGYHPKVSVDGFCTDTGGRENSGALCRAMLLANQVTKPFWAASISQLTCETTAEKRAIVVEQNRDFYWEDFRPGQGWIINLHCITKPMA